MIFPQNKPTHPIGNSGLGAQDDLEPGSTAPPSRNWVFSLVAALGLLLIVGGVYLHNQILLFYAKATAKITRKKEVKLFGINGLNLVCEVTAFNPCDFSINIAKPQITLGINGQEFEQMGGSGLLQKLTLNAIGSPTKGWTSMGSYAMSLEWHEVLHLLTRLAPSLGDISTHIDDYLKQYAKDVISGGKTYADQMLTDKIEKVLKDNHFELQYKIKTVLYIGFIPISYSSQWITLDL